jgi:hypothetical protein
LAAALVAAEATTERLAVVETKAMADGKPIRRSLIKA